MLTHCNINIAFANTIYLFNNCYYSVYLFVCVPDMPEIYLINFRRMRSQPPEVRLFQTLWVFLLAQEPRAALNPVILADSARRKRAETSKGIRSHQRNQMLNVRYCTNYVRFYTHVYDFVRKCTILYITYA